MKSDLSYQPIKSSKRSCFLQELGARHLVKQTTNLLTKECCRKRPTGGIDTCGLAKGTTHHKTRGKTRKVVCKNSAGQGTIRKSANGMFATNMANKLLVITFLCKQTTKRLTPQCKHLIVHQPRTICSIHCAHNDKVPRTCFIPQSIHRTYPRHRGKSSERNPRSQ